MWHSLDSDDLVWNGLAVGWFLVAWLGYGPLVQALWRRGGAVNIDMETVRARWMMTMAHRKDQRLLDGQLMGHALSSASFFASSNLILIAAAAGVLFGGDVTYHKVLQAPGLQHAPRLLFDAKIVLITAALARGLLDFIWSIRQMNYALAVIGATPEHRSPAWFDAYARAAAQILNPAFASSNSGVRGYYFALAAAAWLIGPATLALATTAVVLVLVWRQRYATAAQGVAAARVLLEQPAPPPEPPEEELPTGL
jgi:uncharacterized membrane protein